MTEAAAQIDDPGSLLSELSEEETKMLEERHCVRSRDDVYWVEPSGRVRKERASRLYYIQTREGIYRVSKLSGELIEV